LLTSHQRPQLVGRPGTFVGIGLGWAQASAGPLDYFKLNVGEGGNSYPADSLIGGEMLNGKWMRKGEYRTVQIAKPFGPATWRLYNTVTDPGETTDLSAQEPALLEELKAVWEQYAIEVGVVLSQ
jgi:arylsulfatase